VNLPEPQPQGIHDRRVIGKPNWTDFNSTDELKRSDMAHEFAKTHIYPDLFTPRQNGANRPGEMLFDNGIQHGGAALDLDRDHGIDTIIRWRQTDWPEDASAPICSIQERARSIKHAKFGDLTMTMRNPTGTKGDLFKCMADFFLYGYFDIAKNSFHRVWLISKPRLFMHILGPSKSVNVKTNDKGQTFLTVSLAEIESYKVAIWTRDFTPLDAATEKFLATLPPLKKEADWDNAFALS
jgi:hypothetical protein